mmetsp:Transcript_37929/g.84749  ORF Transcript_37929/g.84749 Transcript_37929/m.84749 type:complete len:207 (-) Transcript_37929:2686-3306(-)
MSSSKADRTGTGGVGTWLGAEVGGKTGCWVGAKTGTGVGKGVPEVGPKVDEVGPKLGSGVGSEVGCAMGTCVGGRVGRAVGSGQTVPGSVQLSWVVLQTGPVQPFWHLQFPLTSQSPLTQKTPSHGSTEEISKSTPRPAPSSRRRDSAASRRCRHLPGSRAASSRSRRRLPGTMFTTRSRAGLMLSTEARLRTKELDLTMLPLSGS